MVTTLKATLRQAASQIGYVESGGADGKSGNITKFWEVVKPTWQGQPWCAAFLPTWAFFVLKSMILLDNTQYFYCPSIENYAKKKGRWGTTPKVGAFVLYSFGKTMAVHIGIVEKILAGGMIQTIEGNTSPTNAGSQNNGGGVYRRVRPTNWGIRGYFYPNYAPEPVAKIIPFVPTLLIDYAWANPSWSSIKASGYTGVLRYISNDRVGKTDYLTTTKNLTLSERDALLAAGMTIGLVWETTASRAGEGASAGAIDVKLAEAQAKALGYPITSPIFYAVDTGSLTVADVTPYFNAVKTGAKYPVGVYGSYKIVEGLTMIPWKWQCYAWSNKIDASAKPYPYISPQAHIYQRLKKTVALPISGTDENIMYKPVPLWGSKAIVPVAVKPVVVKITPIDLDVDGDLGPLTVKATQRWIGVDDDGVWGPISKKALQTKVHTIPNGVIDGNTVNHLQVMIGHAQTGHWYKDTTISLQKFLNAR